MAIKILKNSKTKFVMECEKCECLFIYEMQDLEPGGHSDFIICPCCNAFCSHLNRKKIRRKKK